MKVNRMFYIDADFVEQLKKINASDLINELLKEYYDANLSKNLQKNKELLTKKLKEKKEIAKKIKEFRRNIAEIEQKERDILRFSKNFPEKIIKEVLNFESLLSLHMGYRTGDLKDYRWLEIKQLWQELKGGAKWK